MTHFDLEYLKALKNVQYAPEANSPPATRAEDTTMIRNGLSPRYEPVALGHYSYSRLDSIHIYVYIDERGHTVGICVGSKN